MLNHNTYQEKELLLKISEGDEKAFELLVNAYIDRIYTNALHFSKSPDLAKDICQEVFVKVWNSRSKLPQVENIEAWIVTVATNHIRNTLKKKVLVTSNEEYLLSFLYDRDPLPQELLEWKQLETKIHAAIGELPTQMQTAFRLSRFEGMSHEEIAKRMNISRITSQNYIARALLILKKRLKEPGDLISVFVAILPLQFFF